MPALSRGVLTKTLSSVLASGLLTAAASVALAHPGPIHEQVLPERMDVPEVRASTWRAEGAWLVAPADQPGGEGTRVAAFLEVDDDHPVLAIEARGVDGRVHGDWLALEETFRGDGARVAVVDLDQPWPAAELRIAAADEARIGDLAWELLEPLYPHAGAESRALAEQQTLLASTLDPEFAAIGVVSRDAWGARPTRCTAREDNWYRMAIHHTAGGQTSGGTVEGSVRGLQAYAMDSGTWCDIPYQFLVGYDGSVYEGRALAYRSGATGGANPGNMAVSFLGCYHPNGCPGGNSHAATDEMMRGALTLIQTASRLHDIPIDSQSIRGHRDYGNPTACPGDYVHARLDELRREGPTGASYAAEVVRRSWLASESKFDLVPGETIEVWVDFENIGTSAWEPGVTFLAPTSPRDGVSPLAHASWPAPGRAATVAQTVQPGEIARFSFQIHGDHPGDIEEQFSLVQEGVTWFGDAPLGGGPGDDAVILVVRVSDGRGGGGEGGGEGSAPITDDDDENTLAGGCQAGAGSSSGAVAILLAFAMIALRPTRRRARASC
jgi:hypothetical protein